MVIILIIYSILFRSHSILEFSFFIKYGAQIKSEIKRGTEILEKRYRESIETLEKYMSLYGLFIGMQNEHQKFENYATEMIDLIRDLKFQEAQDLFERTEDERNEVSHRVDLIHVRLEDFARESVEAAEADASTAIKMTRIIAIVEILIAITFAVIVLLYMFRHITKLKEAEDELRQHRDNLEELVEKRTAELKLIKESYEELYNDAPVGYHEINKEGNITRVNQTEAQLLGYTTEEMVGKPIFDFVSPKDREAAKEAVQAKLSGQSEIKPFEREYMRKDDTTFLAYIEEKLLKDDNDQIIGMRSTLLDISKRKNIE